jgi:hypothetical protein
MNNVLSFDKWHRLNEQVNSKAAIASVSKPVSKTPTSGGSKPPMKGGSSNSSAAKPATTNKPVPKPAATTTKPTVTTKSSVTTKPAATTNYSSTAIQISDKISNLFSDTNFWAKFKGTINDDEDGALVAFNNWWNSSIRPMLSKLPSTDPNAQTIIRTQPLIQKALLGSSSSDTVSWTIRGAQGMSKAYSVDTDF